MKPIHLRLSWAPEALYCEPNTTRDRFWLATAEPAFATCPNCRQQWAFFTKDCTETQVFWVGQRIHYVAGRRFAEKIH